MAEAKRSGAGAGGEVPRVGPEATSEEASFDAHHQLQAALIDAYEAALLDDSPRELAADTLGHLVDFSATHFAEEERYMRSIGYPSSEPHRLAHGRLLAELRAMEATCRAAEREAAMAAVPRLRSWLADHVLGMDRDVFRWAGGEGREGH